MLRGIPYIVQRYVQHELPGWGRFMPYLERACAASPEQMATVRGKWHRFRMRLDLSNWSERKTFILGRFYDLPTQLCMKRMLARGDWMLDIGANIGMITLWGAYLVGPGGRIDAIEPNPECCQRIRRAIEENGIVNTHVHQLALGSAAGEAILRLAEEHTGTATLGVLDRPALKELPVSVAACDQLFAGLEHGSRPLRLIKMDVEGYECEVLRGMTETIRQHRPFIITEIEEQLLRRAGSSPAELWGMMSDMKYSGYELRTERRFIRHRLSPRKASVPADLAAANALWAPQERAAPDQI